MIRNFQAIGNPEFINISPCNPLISECEIKVLYVGKNRNRTFISKETATKMANTLPGTPIVGYFREDKADFEEHSERVTIDSDGVNFECLTTPYGFVAPDAVPWFQKFQEADEFGNIVEREYLMVKGYLWTGQFKECQRVLDQGNNHSMELDSDTLQGHWSEDYKTNMEFFIINDAIFSKLCILGEDVEPCFEGSTITAPKVSSSFSKVDDNFRNTLYSMMKELKDMLQGGEHQMDKENTIINPVENEVVEDNTEFAASEEEYKKDETQDKKEKENTEDNQENTEDEKSDSDSEDEDEDKKKKFAKSEDEEDEEEDKDKKDYAKKDDEEEEEKSDDSKEEDEEEDKKEKKFSLEEYSALESKISDLTQQIEDLSAENASLKEFKLGVERVQKEALIKDFYMLSDVDKQDVIDNIDKYSLEDIESKLSVICFRKKINFNIETETVAETPITTFNLEETTDNLPAWLRAVEDRRNGNN